MRYILPALVLILYSCTTHELKHSIRKTEAEEMLNAWHKAAATGSFDQYFAHFADSASIFMGTDRTERWTRNEFMEWSRPHFADGKAWEFQSFNRFINLDDDLKIAWFDEEIKNSRGYFLRGSGVLKYSDNQWKVVQYVLSIPVPNSLYDDLMLEIQQQENAPVQ